MSWVIVLWIGVMVAWGIHAASTSSTVVADCAADGAVKAGYLTQADCVSRASIGIEFGVVTIAIVGLVGLLVLVATWFASRPLWRQGYGARLHPLRLKAVVAAEIHPEQWNSRFENTSSRRH